MTIDEAKEIIGEIEAIDDGLGQYIIGFDKALNIALASLDAWEKVKREIREYFKEGVMDGDIITTHLCEIIDRHLQEVKDEN